MARRSVTFPDGTTVMALAIADRRETDPERDIGLYLEPAWRPDWEAVVIDWPDFGVPADGQSAANQITTAFDAAQSGRNLEIGCLGGLGRTGTVLACMAVLAGVSATKAVTWVRAEYDSNAVETAEQEDWVAWFADWLDAKPIARESKVRDRRAPGDGKRLRVDREGLNILETLSNAFGVSGFEDEVREIIQGLVEPYVDEMNVDPLGNLIVTKRGSGLHTLMIDAHMDEIGFMVSFVEPDGFLRFTTLGGWDARIIPSHKMTIRTDAGTDVRGIVGTLPPHVLSAEDRSRPFKLEELFIDIGATSEEEVAELGIRIGSPATISHPFEQLNQNFVTGKALDDRAGCAVLVRTLMNLQNETPDLNVVGAFTVREELGLLGATTAVQQVNPDIALVLEGTIGADMPGVPATRRVTRLGAGPAITVADGLQVVKPELVRSLTGIAGEMDIPFHYKLPRFGGTDGGAIQKHGRGVLSASVSIPCRYIHSPYAMMRLDDFEHTLALTSAFVRRCGDLVHS